MNTYITLVFVLSFANIKSYDILVINDFPARSTFTAFKSLYKQLALRRHNLTVISRYGLSEEIQNYEEIKFSIFAHIGESNPASDIRFIEKPNFITKYVNPVVLSKVSKQSCENLFSSKSVQDLYVSNRTYDIVMVQIFHTECVFQLAKMFTGANGAMIGYHSTLMVPWATKKFGLPLNPAVDPNYFLAFSQNMSFLERVENTIITSAHILYNNFGMVPMDREIVLKYFGKEEADSLEDGNRISLLLLNTHFSINTPRVILPNIIEVGGMHIEKSKELPQVCHKISFHMYF